MLLLDPVSAVNRAPPRFVAVAASQTSGEACSSAAPAWSRTRRTRNFAKRINDPGGDYADAPVSGGEVGAKNATLSIMVGVQIVAKSAVQFRTSRQIERRLAPFRSG